MTIKVYRENNESFLEAIGRQKKSITVTLDDDTYQPKGRSKGWTMWEDDTFWAIGGDITDEHSIHLYFKLDECGNKTFEPQEFVLWDIEKDLGDGDFEVEF